MTAPYLIFLVKNALSVQVSVKLFCLDNIYSVFDNCTFWMPPFHNTVVKNFYFMMLFFTNGAKNVMGRLNVVFNRLGFGGALYTISA